VQSKLGVALRNYKTSWIGRADARTMQANCCKWIGYETLSLGLRKRPDFVKRFGNGGTILMTV